MAAANNLVVRISAVDATSAAIDAVAKRLAGITAPATKVTKSLARLSDASGVTKLNKAMAALGATAIRTGDHLAGSLTPFTALTSALSVAGVAKMTSDWARATQALSFDATRVGATVERLSALEGSAQLAGSSAQAAASGIRTLQDTMTDTVGGRNMEALTYFRSLGVAFEDSRGHALRATAVLPKLADAIAKIPDPSLQARAATVFFGGAAEDLLPWLRQGSAGMERYAALAVKYGVNTEAGARAARTFSESQTQLEMAFRGLGNSVSVAVSPALSRLMVITADYIGKNRELLALDVKKWGDDYGKAFGALGGVVDKAVTSTVGWNTALEVGVPLAVSRMIPPIARLENALLRLAAIQIPSWLGAAVGLSGGAVASLAAPLLLSGDTPSNPLLNKPATSPGFFGQHGTLETWVRGLFGGGSSSSTATGDPATGQRMMQFFEGQGWTHDQAAGITANLERESAFDPGRTDDNGKAYGLAQWHPDRQAAFAKWAGHDIRGSTLDEQMRFVQWELSHSEKGAGDLLKTAPNAATSAYVVNSQYERPADIPGENTIRGMGAERWAGLGADDDSATRDRLDQIIRREAGDANRPAPTSGDTKHEVTIKVQAAPGTQTITTTTGTGPATVRVHQAMPL